jgi:hypothetical protein
MDEEARVKRDWSAEGVQSGDRVKGTKNHNGEDETRTI